MQNQSADATAVKSWRFWLLMAALFLLFLYMIKAILLPFVVGMMVAYFLDPAADRLEKWGCSRNSATVIITLGFFTLLVLLLLLVLPVLSGQIAGLLAELPSYLENLRLAVEPQLKLLLAHFGQEGALPLEEIINNTSGSLVQMGGRLLSGMLASGLALVNLASLFVLTPVVAFYLLRDWDRLVEKVDRMLPRAHAETIREQFRRIDETLAGFVRGQVNVMLILGIFYAIALSLAGLKFSLLVGLLAGMLIIIPYAGTMVSGLLALGIAYVQFDDITRVLVVLAIFVVGQVMEGYVLTPKLVGEKVGLHPVWVIFGMLAGAVLFGFVGILLAVPVTAVIAVLVRFAIQEYMRSSLYQGEV